MSSYLRRLATLALPLVILAAQPAAAKSVVNAKSLVCGGSGPVDGSIAVTAKDAILTLKFKGKGLNPGEAVVCGYFCQAVFSGGTEVPCATVDAKGKLKAKVELPQSLCFGFLPFFRTGSNGSCVPSIPPP